MGRDLTSAAAIRLDRLARNSFGLFTASDATRLGVSDQLLAHHSRAGGRWKRILPEVYELSDLPPNQSRRFRAALLWGSQEAALSHRAAAVIFGLDGIASAKPELWTPRRGPVAGLILHRGTVRSDETATTKLLRHTTLDRTVLDLATVLHEDALELVIESAIRLDRTVEARLRAAKPRRGGPTLTRVLSRRAPGWPATGSELETRYLQLIRPLGLPDPVRQYPICDSAGRCMFNLDFVWPDVGLWVEMDGRESHGLPKAVFADRHRQNDLITRLPWRLLRFTWDDVMEQQARTLRTTDAAYRQCAAGSAGGSQAS